MAANPPLVEVGGQLFPAPYAWEYVGLSRDGVDLALSGVRTRNGRWSARGVVFLTNMRMVFVAPKPDPQSGLQAFELPLSYIVGEDFKQPIFGCNNLHGSCRLVDSGVEGDQKVGWTVYFKVGGVQTFIPLFYRYVAYVRSIMGRSAAQQQQQQTPAAGAPPPPVSVPPGAGGAAPPAFLQAALVDPSDPTKIYLTQPVASSQARSDTPSYPAPLL